MYGSNSCEGNLSTWQQGATAARSGQPKDVCPYRPENSPECIAWMNGWNFAYIQVQKEAVREYLARK